jgi:arylsulfatase A-like enzyme
MRSLLALWLLFVLAACATDPGPRTADELREHAQGMNVLLVVLDAANARHFSYMGYERETTPNIDRMADESIVFTEVYAQASATPLSMYSMLSSRYPILEEDEYSKTGELAAVMPAALPTLPGWASESFPSRAAFLANRWLREELGFHHGWSTFDKVFEQVPPKAPIPANLVTDAFLGWHATEPAGPWLSWLHYLEPHAPYTPPEPWFSMFDPEIRGHSDGTGKTMREWRTRKPSPEFIRNTIALYDGNLAWVDSEFGRVVDGLKRSGEWDRTIVVVTSDHGEAFWEHGVRGHGTHVYEEFVRIPLLIRVPGLAPKRIDGPVELVDLTPTLLDLAGVFVPQGSTAGQSLVEIMAGETDPTELAFFRNHKNGYLEIGVRRGPLKYHYYFGRHVPELFDLGADPGEQTSLVPDQPPAPPEIGTLMLGMQDLLEQWVQAKSGTGDDFDPALTGADSLDADTIEALRAIGYFGN